MTQFSIKQRLITLFSYLVILYISKVLITGVWILDDGGKSLWFYSAIGLYFFTYLTSPFFVTPRDSLANAATSALLLATIDLSSINILSNEINNLRWASFFLAILAIFFSLSAIMLYGINESERPGLAIFSKISFRISDALGRGQIMFSPPVIISIIGFYQGAIIQQTSLFFIWLILIFIQPVDLFIYIILQLSNEKTSKLKHIGVIQRIDSPYIIRVKLNSTDTWKRDHVHIAHLPDSRQVEVLPLFTQLQNEGLIGTGFYCYDIKENLLHTSPSSIYFSENSRNIKEVLNDLSGDNLEADLIGFVIEKSGIAKICFEMTSDLQFEKGWLIFLIQDKQRVYYQIIDAETKEESFSENPRGTKIVFAEQMGVLGAEKGFQKYGWLPTMNTPVFFPKSPVEQITTKDKKDFELGQVPNSKIGVKANLNNMLEYHTAILGATGTGKTELAFEIVRHAVSNGVKVFCVDFTGEYKPRLADLKVEGLGLGNDQAKKLEDLLVAVETAKYGNEEKGELLRFTKGISPEIDKRVDQFLQPEDSGIGMFEIDEMANTKATLRATELYLSSIFNWARKNRKKRKILVVLEEAHTIVPETSFFGSSDRVETNAVISRMAQIALQGRKYGVGILLVSQRTALVSKTLLSQCNTIICFKIHDETGLKYLANVFSSDHVSIIPNLKFR